MNTEQEQQLVRDAHWTRQWAVFAGVALPLLAAAVGVILYLSRSAAAEEVKTALAPVVVRLRVCEVADTRQDERIAATQASASATARAAEQVADDVYEMRLLIVEELAPLKAHHRRSRRRHATEGP